MFWNDPMLYGATFPYRDLQTQFGGIYGGYGYGVPWQTMQRFVPPGFGFTPYFHGAVAPYLHTQAISPFAQQFTPQTGQHLYQKSLASQQIPFGLPYYGWERPYVY